ncbi:MAG: class I SAM-dependent methyltransferase [Mariprofundaceae bacterium]|nr:class I SAM-dependent methyltransferase [Mariprofundaceae bacterium]
MKQDTVKERERSHWSAAAEGWRRRDDLLRKGSAPVSQRMLEMVGAAPGFQLLDIASGTGEPSISAAHIVGAKGGVIGIDLAEPMLEVAREKAMRQELKNIKFRVMDAELLDFPVETFDAMTMRWGLMFMPNPDKCLASVYKVLRPQARISLACWVEVERNPFVGILLKVLSRYMDMPVREPKAPGIFAFANPDYLHDTIAAAGFSDIKLEEMVIDVLEVEDGRAYWEAISDLAAPVMALVNQLDTATRAAYINDVIQTADTLKEGESLRLQGTTWIATAVK